MRFAEAGHPVRVPGVSHQQLCRPEGEQGEESCSEHGQELEDRHPAEHGWKDCCNGDSLNATGPPTQKHFHRKTDATIKVNFLEHNFFPIFLGFFNFRFLF